jgi:hypothetical protein
MRLYLSDLLSAAGDEDVLVLQAQFVISPLLEDRCIEPMAFETDAHLLRAMSSLLAR